MIKFLPFLLILFAPIIFVIVATIWVYISAKRLRKAGVNIWAPGNWAGVVFLFSPIAVPLYIIFYFAKYKLELKKLHQVVQ